MKTLNFYRQKRRDGGVRTGVELDDDRVLELFKPGRLPQNSALEWFVDVRWRGQRLPNTTDGIRNWLSEQSPAIQEQLQKLAGDLLAGIDPGWPLAMDIPSPVKGISGKIVCSATRRMDSRDISRVLQALSKSWPKLIASLSAYDTPIAA